MSRRAATANGTGPGALALMEEAVHLLRRAPARTLAMYYVGASPFVLGILYFWADMGQGAFARTRCAGASLGVALLFLWMKAWQAAFARELWAQRSETPPPRWTLRRAGRL
ncbi:MAG: hypothetical protein JXR94_02445, partial [Candidatus Hydrogenedentes bacterium]|nr:hypothetical protein [Candidatus Hydrogenedentota bacterium]